MQYTQDYDEKLPMWMVDDGGNGDMTHLNATTTHAGQPGYDQGWAELIQPYLKSRQIMQCPSESNGPAAATSNSMGYTDYMSNLYEIMGVDGKGPGSIGLVAPSQTVLVTDMVSQNSASSLYINYAWVDATGVSVDQPDNRYTRHLGGNNFLFCDGHVKWLKAKSVKSHTGFPCGTGNPGSPTETTFTFCPN